MPTQRYLDISCDGPTPVCLEANSGDPITITNSTGAATTLLLANAGVFNPSHGTSLALPVGDWSGHIGNTSSDYTYPDCEDESGEYSGKVMKASGTRSGRINVS
jgi:hypothetical protein